MQPIAVIIFLLYLFLQLIIVPRSVFAQEVTPESKTGSPPPSPSESSEPSAVPSQTSQKEDVERSKNDRESINRQLERAMSALSHEPSFEELMRAAIENADAGRNNSKRWKKASRLSSILPALKVSGNMTEGRNEDLIRYQEKPDRWGADTDRGYKLDISMQWKLDRIVFNTDELKVYDALTSRALRRENLTALLISLYYERRRLQLETILMPAEELADVLETRMRLEELGRNIDALTGGLLSRTIQSATKSKR